MAIQTAGTGNLAEAQNIVITNCLYAADHNHPCYQLISHYTLGQGAKQITVPKVGQMTATALTDGEDLVNSEDIGLTTVDLTPSEVGMKVILTDKLVRQFNEDVFKVVGRQMGDGMSRKRDRDIIALFSALNGGTTLGADNATLGVIQAAGLAAFARSNKFPQPVYVVHHPNAMAQLAKATMAVGATYYAGILDDVSKQLFGRFWRYSIDGINFFDDGEIDKITSVDSGYGALFSKQAMAIVTSLEPTVKREEDISLRGTEIVIVSDYGVFELDDGYGAPCRHEIGAIDTS